MLIINLEPLAYCGSVGTSGVTLHEPPWVEFTQCVIRVLPKAQ